MNKSTSSATDVRVGIGVFVFKNGTFLLLKRFGSHGAQTWSLPGGHMEFGESFEQTARREVKEETGLDITNVRFGAVTNDIFENEGKHCVTVWMLSDWVSGEPTIMEPEKCLEQQWSSFDNLPEPLFPSWHQLLPSQFYDSIAREIDNYSV